MPPEPRAIVARHAQDAGASSGRSCSAATSSTSRSPSCWASAFGAVVKALVADLLTPIIALIFGKPNFRPLVHDQPSHFLYGDFINALITFVSVAAAIFFFVVKPSSVIAARRARGAGRARVRHAACTECLSEIPKAARRCAFCTAEQTPIAAERDARCGRRGATPVTAPSTGGREAATQRISRSCSTRR